MNRHVLVEVWLVTDEASPFIERDVRMMLEGELYSKVQVNVRQVVRIESPGDQPKKISFWYRLLKALTR